MNEKNMTALVSCFSRSYHCRHNRFPVFKDDVAEKLLTQQEHDSIVSSILISKALKMRPYAGLLIISFLLLSLHEVLSVKLLLKPPCYQAADSISYWHRVTTLLPGAIQRAISVFLNLTDRK